MSESIQLAQAYHKDFGVLIFDKAEEQIIYEPMQDAIKIPGFDFEGKNVRGRGYVIEDIGDCGLEFKYKLTIAEKYKAKAEIFLKILSKREPFFFRPCLSNFTALRISKVNPTLLTTLGFYVRLKDSATFNRSDDNLAIVEFDVTLVEVRYKPNKPTGLLAQLDSAFATLSNVLSDISLYANYVREYIQATATFLNNTMNQIKSIGDDISSTISAVDVLSNSIDDLVKFPSTIATQYQNISGQLKTTFDKLSRSGNNTNENKYAQKRLIKAATSMSTYNQNPALNTPVNPRFGFINIDGVKENIAQGKLTFWVRATGLSLLLSLADKINFSSRQEIQDYMDKLTELKNFIFNDTQFDGITNSDQALSEALGAVAWDVNTLDTLNTIYYQTINALKDQKIILADQAPVVLDKDYAVHGLIFKYYYQRITSGVSADLIYQTFLTANGLYDANVVLPKGFTINLPVL